MSSNVCQHPISGPAIVSTGPTEGGCPCPLGRPSAVAAGTMEFLPVYGASRAQSGIAVRRPRQAEWSSESRARYLVRINQLRIETRQCPFGDIPEQPLDREPSPRMAAFFLVLFVFGQVTSAWALVAGHDAAWITGMVFSVFGITVALGSLASQIVSQRRSVDHLSNPSRPAQASVDFRRSSGKPSVKATV